MRVILKIDVPYGDIPLAGVSAKDRMTAIFRQAISEDIALEELSAATGSTKGETLWVYGLFPFLERADLERFLVSARDHSSAIWHPGGDVRHGILFARQASAALQAASCLEEALASMSSAPHHFGHGGEASPCPHTPETLATCQNLAFERNVSAFLKAGVRIVSPAHTWVETGVEIAAGALLGPNVYLAGATKVAAGAEIHMGSVLHDVTVGDGAIIKPYSVISESVIGAGAWVGPFAHVRPGTVLEERVRVGNFVETKKVHMAADSKASHLTYLGDARIGRETNIGAGTITCNYDGFNKHQTQIGDRVFIGSDSQLVAPVTLGDDSFVAAGSTVTRDVPEGSLAISRGKQVVKADAARRIRQRAQRKKPSEPDKS